MQDIRSVTRLHCMRQVLAQDVHASFRLERVVVCWHRGAPGLFSKPALLHKQLMLLEHSAAVRQRATCRRWDMLLRCLVTILKCSQGQEQSILGAHAGRPACVIALVLTLCERSQSDFLKRYHEARGDKCVSLSRWRRLPGMGLLRELQFVSPLKAHPPPAVVCQEAHCLHATAWSAQASLAPRRTLARSACMQFVKQLMNCTWQAVHDMQARTMRSVAAPAAARLLACAEPRSCQALG